MMLWQQTVPLFAPPLVLRFDQLSRSLHCRNLLFPLAPSCPFKRCGSGLPILKSHPIPFVGGCRRLLDSDAFCLPPLSFLRVGPRQLVPQSLEISRLLAAGHQAAVVLFIDLGPSAFVDSTCLTHPAILAFLLYHRDSHHPAKLSPDPYPKNEPNASQPATAQQQHAKGRERHLIVV